MKLSPLCLNTKGRWFRCIFTSRVAKLVEVLTCRRRLIKGMCLRTEGSPPQTAESKNDLCCGCTISLKTWWIVKLIEMLAWLETERKMCLFNEESPTQATESKEDMCGGCSISPYTWKIVKQIEIMTLSWRLEEKYACTMKGLHHRQLSERTICVVVVQ